jgi:ribosomal-protein-alanine N-acetyltransferase
MNDQPSPLEPKVRLGPGNSRDLPAVMQVMEAAFDDRFGESWTRSQCAGILPMPGVKLMIVRLGNGTPAAFSLSRTVADESELLLLAVAPELRRRGIGQMLLDHFIEQALANGSSKVHLEVREGNPAVMMYRAAGFSAVGRRRKYYRGRGGGEFDALTLKRSLQT